MEPLPIVDTIIENEDGRILMLKRNFHPKDKLDLLGGYVEKNEGLEEGAIREAKEESGLDVELGNKLGAYDYFDRGEKRMHVFVAKNFSGELTSSKEGEPVWTDLASITSNDLAFPQVHVDVINDFLKSKGSGTVLRR